MKIAITGANGFVGAALCRYFHRAGHEIIAIGNCESPNQNLLKIAEYIPADISRAIPPIDADACIHTAALASDTDTYKSLIISNVEGTLNVVEAARKCRYFIHISSSSVYQFKDRPLREEDATIDAALSDYGETRLLAEDIVDLDIPEHQKRLIMRPRAIYGIGDRILLPRLLRLVRGSYLICPFKRNIQSSLTHVDNVGYAIELFFGQENSPPVQIFNISDEEPYFLRDLLLQCSRAVKKKQLRAISPPPFLLHMLIRVSSGLYKKNTSQPVLKSFDGNTILDISAIRKQLNYRPVKNFQNSCTEIAGWLDTFGSPENYLKQLSDAPWAVSS